VKKLVTLALAVSFLVGGLSTAQAWYTYSRCKVKDVVFETETGTGQYHPSVWFHYYVPWNGSSYYAGFWLDDVGNKKMGKYWLTTLLTAYTTQTDVQVGFSDSLIGYFSTFVPAPAGYTNGYVKRVEWLEVSRPQ
jgi:hypothetical protein